MREDLRHELQVAAVGTVLLDFLVWIGSLFVMPLNWAFPLGLLIGSAGILLNLLLLRKSILNAVYHGKTRDFQGYLFRVAIASAAIASGLICNSVNAVAVVLPFLYPKIIFGFLAVRKK